MLSSTANCWTRKRVAGQTWKRTAVQARRGAAAQTRDKVACRMREVVEEASGAVCKLACLRQLARRAY
jgi:hypothetical protein